LTTEPYRFTKSEFFGFIIAAGLSIWYCWRKDWIINNIIGLAFSFQAISLFSMGSYQIGCILLGGLFLYDIFWVFGTDVMVTVAKSFDAPVKLMFPRNLFAAPGVPWQFSMLGLGDIVIPGFFIAMMLRFDYRNSVKKKGIKKPYFHACFIAYILGLITTIAVMHVFKAAQPALLYLVPFCLVSTLGMAVSRGELSKMWNYEESAPVSSTKKTKKSNGASDSSDPKEEGEHTTESLNQKKNKKKKTNNPNQQR